MRLILSIVLLLTAETGLTGQNMLMAEAVVAKPGLSGGVKQEFGVEKLKPMAGFRIGLNAKTTSKFFQLEYACFSIRYTHLFSRKNEVKMEAHYDNGNDFNLEGTCSFTYNNIMPQVGAWGIGSGNVKHIFLLGMGISWCKLIYDFPGHNINDLIIYRAPWHRGGNNKNKPGESYSVLPGFMLSYGNTFETKFGEVYFLFDVQTRFGDYVPFVPSLSAGVMIDVPKFNFVEN